MKVCEIFASIQGESSYAGLPCSFIRLAGCNLRCVYCDTRYSHGAGTEMQIAEIIRRIRAEGLELVEITGGEPLLQEDTPRLVKSLIDEGFKVLVETNGSFSIRHLDKKATIILDVKTPGSGMDASIDFANFDYIKPFDEIKFVLCGRTDYDWAREFLSSYRLESKCTVLFSPVTGMLDPSALSQWITEDRLGVRLNLQLHKYIFGPDARGR
jgi:7-carboxy-7-deazaguanine synthase